MSGTDKLSVDQNPQDILSRQCLHSKVCSTIVDDWRDIWDIDISPDDRIVSVVCNENITFHTFQTQAKDSLFLATIRSNETVVFLYTVTSRQETPFCSVCTTKKCKHAVSYYKKKEEKKKNRLFLQ